MTAKYTSVNVCCDATQSVKCMHFALHKILELHVIHRNNFRTVGICIASLIIVLTNRLCYPQEVFPSAFCQATCNI